MTLLSVDGSRLGDTGGPLAAAALKPFQDLVARAAQEDDPKAHGYARLPPDGPGGKLYSLLVVPIYAPRPEIVAWIGLALPIDHEFATELKEDAQLEVTFYYGASGAMSPVESTLPAVRARSRGPLQRRGGRPDRGRGRRALCNGGQGPAPHHAWARGDRPAALPPGGARAVPSPRALPSHPPPRLAWGRGRGRALVRTQPQPPAAHARRAHGGHRAGRLRQPPQAGPGGRDRPAREPRSTG
jgi:hypothetical protein